MQPQPSHGFGVVVVGSGSQGSGRFGSGMHGSGLLHSTMGGGHVTMGGGQFSVGGGHCETYSGQLTTCEKLLKYLIMQIRKKKINLR